MCTGICFVCRKKRDFGVAPVVIHSAVQSLPCSPELSISGFHLKNGLLYKLLSGL